MAVLLDSGVYRHLRFKQPGTGVAWFDVVTWPGFLAFAGDMGSFVFARVEDMFKFFRSDRRADGELRINPGYWGEKLEAVDTHTHHPGHREFSPQRFRGCIEEKLAEWIQDCGLSKADATGLRGAIDREVLSTAWDGEHEARVAVNDFKCEMSGNTFEFHDASEFDFEDYTYRFIWCCYAIAWAVRKYDDATSPVTAVSL
ncbi:MAG TPA: hypothetical protein DIT28_01320 [Oxalobacteraceae bacterium]|nr:hypothetical protein [Oxalobacteraceae bacterium]